MVIRACSWTRFLAHVRGRMANTLSWYMNTMSINAGNFSLLSPINLPGVGMYLFMKGTTAWRPFRHGLCGKPSLLHPADLVKHQKRDGGRTDNFSLYRGQGVTPNSPLFFQTFSGNRDRIRGGRGGTLSPHYWEGVCQIMMVCIKLPGFLIIFDRCSADQLQYTAAFL